MTTITIDEDLNLQQTHFKTLEDAYFAWLDAQDKVYLRPLPPEEMTEQRKKDFEKVQKMKPEEFLDI